MSIISASPKSKTTTGKKKDSSQNNVSSFLKDERLHRILGLFFIITSIFLAFSFTSYLFTWETDQSVVTGSTWEVFLTNNPQLAENKLGLAGAYISHAFLNNGFGIASYLAVLWLFLLGWRVLLKKVLLPWRKTFNHSFFAILWIPIALGFIFDSSHFYLGGAFGHFLSKWLVALIGSPGTVLFLLFSILSLSIWSFGLNLANISLFKKKSEPEIAGNENGIDTPHIISNVDTGEETATEALPENLEIRLVEATEVELGVQEEIEPQPIGLEIDRPKTPPVKEKSSPGDISLDIEETIQEEEVTTTSVATDSKSYDPTLDLSSYKFPSLDLLENYGDKKTEVTQEELEANKNRIIETLGNYKIGISQIKATIGPTVTLYEIVPDAGIRIAKIKNLEADIALSLSALGIRIIAPIPGKGTIGIEVPNKNPEIVSMRSVLATERFKNTTFDLPIALGKNISNEVFIADLASMPHLLIAGATGQGKSVGLNAILSSLLYKKHPAELKFVLVDPKKVELSLFKAIEKHFLAKLPDEEEAIITDTRKVIMALNSLCIEMDQRYELLKDAKARNIKEYNKKFISRNLNPQNKHRFLPYIVLVIDEFADLIMTCGKEAEMPIARLAQLARAVGLHLVIATQRPSVNIITGTIKANFPARIAYKVMSVVDSRTILDQGGADQLIGRGDMLFYAGSDIVRIQCAFLDTPEVERITTFIGEQRGYPEAYKLPEYVDESAGPKDPMDAGERDPLFEDAARIIVQHQQGSTSLIQRRMKLGYNRAGRIMDQLEIAGIVGPPDGSKPREVLIMDEYALEQILNSNDGKDENKDPES